MVTLKLQDHGNFIAETAVRGAAETIGPDLLRKGRTLDLQKAELVEKLLLIGQREDTEELQRDRLGDAGFHQFPSDPLHPVLLVDMEGADLRQVFPNDAHRADPADLILPLVLINIEIPQASVD